MTAARRSLWTRLAAVLLAAALVGCGGGDGGGGDGGGGGGDGGGGGGNQDGTCRGDRVTTASPRVQVRPPGGVLTPLSGSQDAACETEVDVDGNGGANVLLADQAHCRMDQGDQPTKVAELVTRRPGDSLFELKVGHASCVFSGALVSQGSVDLCGIGVLRADGDAIGNVSCDVDPVFQAAVYQGSLKVTAPNGAEVEMGAGEGLSYDFEQEEVRQELSEFSDQDVALFQELAGPLGIEVAAPPTSPPPPLEPPFFTEGPSIAEETGGSLVAVPGTWTGEPTFTYRWQRGCASDGSGCTDIPDATQPSYLPTGKDCPAVRVVLTASNEGGSTTATSEPFVPSPCVIG
jgi:hypothetical protein